GLQLLLRPKVSLSPYHTPHPAVFICSSATPPAEGCRRLPVLSSAHPGQQLTRATLTPVLTPTAGRSGTS
ncbi:hypothetical protein AB0942_19125, partial [Streptomyces nodosus]|uniref:hypothetical protein n=1 Tax=Streptomyces nodosus TaxID=40318 RepID=UPI003453BCFC